MASVRSVIELAITGSTRGLASAAAEARAMAERVAAAEDRVSQARLNSANAESRVSEAEARLNEARARGNAATAAVGDAEQRVTDARTRSLASSDQLGAAERELAAIRGRGGSAQEIAAAEQRIQQARRQADADTTALEAAERRLAATRSTQGNAGGRVQAAEEALARARNNAFRASENLARAERDLGVIQRRGTDDLNRQRDGILGVFDSVNNLIQAFTGADGASTSFLAKMGALQQVLGNIGGPIAGLVIGVLELVAALGAAGEIIGVVGGLIGQVLGAAVPTLFALAAAAGTAALGMDGIKKAAEVMAPAFDKLKASVSAVFVQQLTPAFQQLAKAIPLVTAGFKGIALALSGLIGNVVRFVASWEGMRHVQDILSGTEAFVRGLSKGVLDLVTGMLRAADVGAPAFARLGEAIGSIGTRIGDVFSRLSADGTIGRALDGFSATIQGLGAVIAPVVEILIRMGAALGDSVGSALTELGNIIRSTTPFFENLARVAGTLLAEAFRQLGPPIEKLFGGTLPAANKIMDEFAAFITGTVLPAIAGFINFLATDGISGIESFVKSAAAGFLEFASGVLDALSQIAAAAGGLFLALAPLFGPEQQQQFLQAAQALGTVKEQIDKVKATVDTAHDKVIAFQVNVPSDRTTGEQGALGVAAAMDRVQPKTVTVTANVPSGPLVGEQGALGVAAAMDRVRPKTVTVTANVPSGPLVGEQGALGVAAAMDRVQPKTVTTTANVPSGPQVGLQGNQELTGAIGAVFSKTTVTSSSVPGGPTLGTQGNQALTGAITGVNSKAVTTTGNVPGGPTLGTQGNQALTGAIARVLDKTVKVIANVFGLSGVTSLIDAIGRVKDKVVNIVANVIGAGAHFLGLASGGQAPGGVPILVGEEGPELIMLPRGGGFVNNANQTRQILNASRPAAGTSTATESAPAAADQPITVNVMLSQEAIAGIAQVEIARRDRQTKRTVLAGSGVTF